MEHERRRKEWFAGLPFKVIEVVIFASVMYGSFRVTVGYLSADVDNLKTKSEKTALQINTLETKFNYIQESLERIEKKIERK